MRILFLNQYFPPDPAPTGVLLRELGDYLLARGHEVEYISAAQKYGERALGPRIVRELRAFFSILIQGLKATRPDVVISASSPPCLLLAATGITWRHKCKSAHWLMDMYPELAVELGELKSRRLAHSIYQWMRAGYRKTNLIVTLDADMAARLKNNYEIDSEIIRPWLSESLLARLSISDPVAPAIWTWIYSGNLGRAHEWKTLLDTQAILEQRGLPFRLVFQGGGAALIETQRYAQSLNLRNCVWRDYVPEQQLRATLFPCQVLIATQKPEAKGLLWPSKLSLLREMPRPILWVGPIDGAVARELSARPGSGIFAPGQPQEIANWLQALRANGNFSINVPSNAIAERESSLQKWHELLRQF